MDVVHVFAVGGSELDVLLSEEPAGEAAELPLGADVGTGTDYGEEVLLLDGLEEFTDVEEILHVGTALAEVIGACSKWLC